MSINTEINRLLNFAKQNMLINEDDYYYAANRLLDVLKVDAFEPEFVDEKLPTAMPILENMLDYAAEKGLIENTTENRDLFDTRIMDCVMPRPSEVVRRFRSDYARSPKAATDEFYKMSIASNYIRKDRIDKNIIWKTATEYGDLDITINLSKPEKDPRDIAKARAVVWIPEMPALPRERRICRPSGSSGARDASPDPAAPLRTPLVLAVFPLHVL